jgi:hypothetical protein
MNIVAANILNDIFKSDKYPNQKNRIPTIADDINSKIKEIDVLFVCEGTISGIKLLAKSLDLTVADKPYLYSTKNDYAAFLINKKYYKNYSVKFTRAGNKNSSKFGFITLIINEINIVGVHYPYKPVLDGGSKKDFTRTILSMISSEKTLVVGDFNNPRIMKSRKQFTKKGLKEVIYKNTLKNPSDDFIGVIVPKFYPRLVIDGAYYSPKLNIKSADMFYSKGTDHPIQLIKVT